MPIDSFPSLGTIGGSLLPKRYDIVIYEGDTLDIRLNFKDGSNVAIDLSGFTGLCKIKDNTDTTVIVTPTVTVNYGAVTGQLRIYLQDTTALPEGDYLYDVQLTDLNLDVRTYIGGKVSVTKDVSN